MDHFDNNDWLVNIENTAVIVCKELGAAIVESVYRKYGAHNLEDLSPTYYSEVFNELYAIEVDLK